MLRTAVSSPLCCPESHPRVILNEAKDPSPVLLLSCSAKGWEIRILRPQDDGHGGLYFLPFPGLAFFLAFGLAQPAFRLG